MFKSSPSLIRCLLAYMRRVWFSVFVVQVHGAFAGFSGITVGTCNTHYAYFPITEVISHPQLVDPNSRMWHRCLTSTGQPDFAWPFISCSVNIFNGLGNSGFHRLYHKKIVSKVTLVNQSIKNNTEDDIFCNWLLV